MPEKQDQSADDQSKQTGDDATKKLVTDAVTAATSELTKSVDDLKSINQGLHKKIAEQETEKTTLDKEKAAAAEAAKAAQLTDSERIAALEDREVVTKREMDAKERDSTLREKKANWNASAAKRGLPEATFVDPSLSPEDGETHLDTLKAGIDASVKDGINKGLASGTPPGSGNEGTEATEIDLTGKTPAEARAILIADEQKKLEASMKAAMP